MDEDVDELATRLDFNTRLAVEHALEECENLVSVLRTALADGWPPEVLGDFPVLTNWVVLKKSRMPCLEGNYFWVGSDGTERSQTAPLILHDSRRGLALTTDGWIRTEQPLVPPEDDG